MAWFLSYNIVLSYITRHNAKYFLPRSLFYIVIFWNFHLIRKFSKANLRIVIIETKQVTIFFSRYYWAPSHIPVQALTYLYIISWFKKKFKLLFHNQKISTEIHIDVDAVNRHTAMKSRSFNHEKLTLKRKRYQH